MTPAFVFFISKGTMAYADGREFASGLWSGHPPAMNEPSMTSLKAIGPLPIGFYGYGAARDGGHLGCMVMPLSQLSGESFGRGGFFIHGPSLMRSEYSSDGCIIMPRAQRVAMDAFVTPSRVLEVRA